MLACSHGWRLSLEPLPHLGESLVLRGVQEKEEQQRWQWYQHTVTWHIEQIDRRGLRNENNIYTKNIPTQTGFISTRQVSSSISISFFKAQGYGKEGRCSTRQRGEAWPRSNSIAFQRALGRVPSIQKIMRSPVTVCVQHPHLKVTRLS